MNNKNFRSSLKKRNKARNKLIVLCIGILLVNLVVVGALLINNPLLSDINGDPDGIPQRDFNGGIQTQGGADISLLENPYTKNFNDTWTFFNDSFTSQLGFDIATYYREGSEDGTISEDLIYSLDNLLLYNTLLKSLKDYDSSQILEKYSALKETLLWYAGSEDYDYGFVESVDNSTGEVNNYRRYLIDNLMPIFLLGENIDDSVEQSYIDELATAFNLINSSEFYDDSANIFKHYNNSGGEVYTKDNLYGVLANLLLNKTDTLDNDRQNRAGQLANQTMESLKETYWDNTNKGYIYSDSNNYKNLETNAVGIITLLEYWKKTNNSEYLDNATSVFREINSTLYHEGIYLNRSDVSWSSNSTKTADLKANSLMMKACLNLFEVTGNKSYYNAATDIYNTFETEFYDGANGGYRKSKTFGTGLNDKKNLLYNLRISEAYHTAKQIYDNSSLKASFDKSGFIPEFIFNQETLNLTTSYSYNSSYASCGIPVANVSYTIRYPNGTIINNFNGTTDENGTNTFSYEILSEELPLGNLYSITVLANASFHKFVNISRQFNVTGGIKYDSGLEDENEYFQGSTHLIALSVNSTRDSNIQLNFSIEADSILINSPQNFTLFSSQKNMIFNNFTIKNDAEPGNYKFHFILKNESTIFFDYVKTIEIRNALQITNLVYDSEIVKGDIFQVNLTATNKLQNASQTFNLSISGNNIENVRNEYNLSQFEMRIISNDCNISSDITSDTMEVDIVISKGETSYYSKSITLEVVNKMEIVDCSFSESVAQATPAYLVLIIKNNMKESQEYTLYINSWKITGTLKPGENRIVESLVPTINPYDFSPKTYSVKLYDENNNEVYRNLFQVNLELSVMFLVLCYILPIIAPIAIVIYLKNKQVKMDRLRGR